MSRGTLVMERTLAGTMEEVWALWTTPDGIASWWGPQGFAVAVRSMDLRAGGRMVYVQTAVAPDTIAAMQADGIPVATELQITFDEVVPPSRLVYTTLADFIPGVQPYPVTTAVDLVQLHDRVRMTLTFERMHDDEWTARAAGGWTSELDRLERRLAQAGTR